MRCERIIKFKTEDKNLLTRGTRGARGGKIIKKIVFATDEYMDLYSDPHGSGETG